MEPYILDYYNDFPQSIKVIDKLNEENNKLQDELNETQRELDFYKSVFKTHRNSVIFNLYIKYKNRERIWIDKIGCSNYELNLLDKDEDIIEWLTPIRCER
tara:strand:- start:591 stop:893 length:303 start_codon:yes stop_codon:yes gene_type:complete